MAAVSTKEHGKTGKPVRKDAERNRHMLIKAASDIMRANGGDVPMEVIAEHAKLTRGTLYRNFPHRQAMYEAVLEHDLKNIGDVLASDNGADPLAFIRHMARLMMVYDKFLISLADMPDYDAAKNEARMVDLIASPLAAAQDQGALRSDLTGDDILTACRMLASNWRLDDQPDLYRAFETRFALLMHGLGPTPDPASPSVPQRPGPDRFG